MRIVTSRTSALLSLLGAGLLSIALADTPAEPAATPAAAPAAAPVAPGPPASTAAPAAASNAATAASAATTNAAASRESDAALEKRLTNSGYKPKTRNGATVWCKREAELGSRLGGQEVCGTPDELRRNAQEQQDAVRSVQTLYNATGK